MFDLLPCALVVAAVALATDLTERRIPNGLTLPALAVGLAAQLALHGWGGLAVALLGVAVGFGLLLVPFVFGYMGAGDVKLMAAIGAFVGPLSVLAVVLVATLAAGLGAAIIAARQGLCGRAARGALALVGLGAPPAGSVGSLPYAVPIAIGTFLAAPLLGSLLR